jgi:hypothetical protein
MVVNMPTIEKLESDPNYRPWYREPWPWILMAGPTLVILAGAVTTAIAFAGADGLVADDYYKLGLAINRTLARESRAQALGIAGTIAFEPHAVRARLRSSGTLPDRIRLVLAHPTRANADRVVFLARSPEGDYLAPIEGLTAGRWDLVLEAADWRISTTADTRSPAAVAISPPRS